MWSEALLMYMVNAGVNVLLTFIRGRLNMRAWGLGNLLAIELCNDLVPAPIELNYATFIGTEPQQLTVDTVAANAYRQQIISR